MLRDRFSVNDIADFNNMETEDREKVLPTLSEKDMMAVAAVCNRYPNNELISGGGGGE